MSFQRIATAGLITVLMSAPLGAQQEVQDLPVFGSFTQNGVGFIVSGPHARTIFDAMRAQTMTDDCTGGWTKVDASGFNCTVYPDGQTECSFGYDYNTQRLTRGPLTC